MRKQVNSEKLTASVSKRVFVQNHLYENVFRLQVHFQANQTHFRKKDFACTTTRFETKAQGNSEITYDIY